MSRRRMIVAVAGLIVGLSLSGAGKALAADEQLELLVPGELSVATEGTFPPFSMQDAQGTLDGLEIRLMQEIARRLGLEYKPVLIKWESILVGLFSDQYDIVSAAMDITSERQKQVLFSRGWLESGGRFVVRDDAPISDASDIDGKVVGVLVASTWADLAKEKGAKEIKTYKAETDAVQDLLNGNIDGVVTDSIAAAYMIEEKGLPLKLTEGYLSQIQKGWPTKKERANLIKAINVTLDEMIADGTYAELTTPLVGYSPAPAEPIPSNFEE
jgi:polar amino acid transport system substrate-binding protein